LEPERWREIDRLYQAAVELDGVERAVFLDRECGGDREFSTQVEAMLEGRSERNSRRVQMEYGDTGFRSRNWRAPEPRDASMSSVEVAAGAIGSRGYAMSRFDAESGAFLGEVSPSQISRSLESPDDSHQGAVAVCFQLNDWLSPGDRSSMSSIRDSADHK
jgi:hypothetical protein